jgi:hypothetical protein
MRRERPASANEMVVRYSASEMPIATIETLQRDNCDAFARDEIDARNAFRVCNLLLTISLLKLQEEVAA